MDIHIGIGFMKAVIATAVFIIVAIACSRMNKPDSKLARHYSFSIIALTCVIIWLGCFTLVKIVWP